MSAVPKTGPETISNATKTPLFKFDVISDKNRQSVDQPQSEPVPDQVAPSKARTLFVVAWIAVIAAVAGSIIWAALANPA
jgi:hypothetical protein